LGKNSLLVIRRKFIRLASLTAGALPFIRLEDCRANIAGRAFWDPAPVMAALQS